ncbi:MAG: ABC transporter substrate-binding protein [Oscillibacter sp.]
MKKRILAVVLAVSLLSVVLTGCGDGSTEKTPETTPPTSGEAVQGGELTVGIAQDLDNSLDPHLAVAAGTKEVMFNVFEGLMKPTPDGDLLPAVAEHYDLSQDRTTYTFALRDGVTFHNGEPVTADDVVYSIKRCADDSKGKPLVPAFSVIQSVAATDEKTVTITIAEPNNEFISYMTAAILPRNYPDQATAPVGTGPFKFVSRVAQDSIVLERNGSYWGEKPYLDKVTFKIMENADSLVLSLQSGAIDLCAHLTNTQVAQLSGYNILEGTMNLVQALYLNNAAAPFDDVRVRQALCYAVDKQEILDLTADGHGSVIGSSMYPAFQKYFVPELAERYGRDVEKAKQLLSDAGYPQGFDMTITVPSNYTPHMDAAQVLVEQLKAIGVTATIQPVEWESWVNDVYMGRQFQSTLVGVDASNMTARALLERFTSTYEKNFINYNNADYDALFAQAQATPDDAAQVALYKQMQENLSDNAANVYIQDLADLVAIRSNLDGFRFYPIYVLDLSGVHYVK